MLASATSAKAQLTAAVNWSGFRARCSSYGTCWRSQAVDWRTSSGLGPPLGAQCAIGRALERRASGLKQRVLRFPVAPVRGYQGLRTNRLSAASPAAYPRKSGQRHQSISQDQFSTPDDPPAGSRRCQESPGFEPLVRGETSTLSWVDVTASTRGQKPVVIVPAGLSQCIRP